MPKQPSAFDLCPPIQIAHTCGRSVPLVSAYFESLRDIVELHVARGHVAVLDGFVLATDGHPLRRWVADNLPTYGSPAWCALFNAAMDKVEARSVEYVGDGILAIAGAPRELVGLPLVTGEEIVSEVQQDLQERGFVADLDDLEAIAISWAECIERQPTCLWPFQRPAVESLFEDWLSAHMDVLTPFGLPLRVARLPEDPISGRQWRTADGTGRADLVARFTDVADVGAEQGTWAVLELKTVPADVSAVHQVLRYRDALASEGIADAAVPIVVAPGATARFHEAAERSGVVFVSTAQLGFRALRTDE